MLLANYVYIEGVVLDEYVGEFADLTVSAFKLKTENGIFYVVDKADQVERAWGNKKIQIEGSLRSNTLKGMINSFDKIPSFYIEVKEIKVCRLQ